MAWTWAEIENDWLVGNRIALPPQTVVDAFDRVERTFGREWIESSRLQNGIPTHGTRPTLHVAFMGQLVAALDGLAGAERLLELLRQNDPSATAEVTAIHHLRWVCPTADVELYPSVKVGERLRQPDFRVREDGESVWTYFEVTRPDVSEEQQAIAGLAEQLTAFLGAATNSFALEVFLRRRPVEREVEHLTARIPVFCSLDGIRSEELPEGLGVLSLNQCQPGVIVPLNHPGEPNCPRLGFARGFVEAGQAVRHIAVRIAYADERAKQFLSDEAKQLPTEYPGLIMVEMSRAPGGFQAWEPLLQRCFQPTQRTRVGAVCLFMSAQELTPNGAALVPHTKVLVNPHARLPLASWITDGLRNVGRQSGGG
jgi:hypothetical protein